MRRTSRAAAACAAAARARTRTGHMPGDYLCDAPLAALHAVLLHNQIKSRGNLGLDNFAGQIQTEAHHHHEARHDLCRRVRVQGGERTVVASVHGLQHVGGLGAATLAHHDAVGALAQGVDDEVSDGHLAASLGVCHARLHAHHVRMLVEAQLGGILDGDDALVFRYLARERVEQRGLAAARAAGDGDVFARAHRPGQKLRHTRRKRAQPHELVEGESPPAEFSYGQGGALHGDGWDDHIHAMSFRQPRVHNGALLVYAPAQRRDDAVDHEAQLLFGGKGTCAGVNDTVALEEDVLRAVCHHLRDVRVGQKLFERA